jgi:hypothetical protein
MLGVNHSYEKSALSSADLTAATIEGRQELNQVVIPDFDSLPDAH